MGREAKCGLLAIINKGIPLFPRNNMGFGFCKEVIP